MTEPTELLTYTGRQARGTVALPTRRVRFARGADPVPFTVDELDHLDPADWAELSAGVPGGPHVGHEVPVGLSSTLIDDGHGPALVLTEGAPLGTIDEVLALATTSERAAALLAHEVDGKNRARLVRKLTALTGDGNNPADSATNQGG